MNPLPLLLLAFTSTTLAADIEWIKVADDNKSFVLAKSGQKFIPWGFKYDPNRDGSLLEDYSTTGGQ